jgi:peptidyl-prolyl cis-trans isomerase B (cyclophilin B)
LRRQVQRRAEREARHRRFVLIASIVGTLVIAGVVIFVVVQTSSDNSTNSTAGGAGSTPTGNAGNPPTCTWTPSGSPARQVSVPPTQQPPKTGTVDLLAQTTRGTMTFQLNRAAAPCAVDSFVSLTQQHYFDGTPCHRLTSGGLSVLQCGDPTGTGKGGPGYAFGDELTGHEKYTRGVLAMANSGPNTNGSQFFIVYKNLTLSPNYTIFGKVTSGMKVVDKVAAAGSNPSGDGRPKLSITLTSVAQVA